MRAKSGLGVGPMTISPAMLWEVECDMEIPRKALVLRAPPKTQRYLGRALCRLQDDSPFALFFERLMLKSACLVHEVSRQKDGVHLGVSVPIGSECRERTLDHPSDHALLASNVVLAPSKREASANQGSFECFASEPDRSTATWGTVRFATG